MAQDINLKAVEQSVFGSLPIAHIQRFGKTSLVVKLPEDDHKKERFVAVYRYGSIIFFNVDDTNLEASGIIRKVQKHATEPALAGFERSETFAVHISPDHPVVNTTFSTKDHVSSVVTADYLIVPELDMNGVAVISNIMAQTVALKNYDDIIENLLSNFERINSAVTKTGNFSATDIDFLFKTVAQNNSIYLDMISKIRIKDRADTAWEFVKYENIHYGLKDEFEIEEQFEAIEYKLDLIQQNAEFFLQSLQDENESTVEWFIIAAICLEGVLMIIDMSGLGASFFQNYLLKGSSLATSLVPPPP